MEPQIAVPFGVTSYLMADITEAAAVFTTDAGEQKVAIRGSIGFELTQAPRRKTSVSLIRLNLVTEGVKTKSGHSGVLGLMLAKQPVPIKYDPSKGGLEAAFDLVLHYPLIDQKLGFKEKRVKEDTCFVPYTETMAARLTGHLPRLAPEEKGQLSFDFELKAELSQSVLKAVYALVLIKKGYISFVLSPASVLPIQPVFIGTGPSDPNATGKAFDELMNRAMDMWNRCGKVHCLLFDVRPPVYLNKSQYRVVDTQAEMNAFSLEYSVTDAVEIFVADKFDVNLAVNTGGGGTYSSGTAAARIVTCDQQLNVPCPPPCGSGSCGDVNHYHLAHELGHVLNLDHPNGAYGMQPSTAGSVMEPSGFCKDNPNVQSAKNCRNASNPLLTSGKAFCFGKPDIMD